MVVVVVVGGCRGVSGKRMQGSRKGNNEKEKVIEIEKKTASWPDYLILCLRAAFEGPGGVRHEWALCGFTQERPA